MRSPVGFVVLGVPQPQGSMRAVISRTTGRPMVKSDNVRLRSWRQEAAWEANNAKPIGMLHPFQGPVRVHARFVFVRPKSVSAKRRPHHTVKPDADKLVRALCDALTGVLWRDDAQVVAMAIEKHYGPDAKTCVEVAEYSTEGD